MNDAPLVVAETLTVEWIVDNIVSMTQAERDHFMAALMHRVCFHCFRAYSDEELRRCSTPCQCWNDE